MLTVFVRGCKENEEEKSENYIELCGYVCKPPVFRVTPFNREIADVLIAVNRAYNKSDYIPCIAWGRNARFASHLSVGDKITIVGRIQSREYQKVLEDGSEETRTAYEISISRISIAEE
jgi:single-stranded DNA-binding protein